MKTKKFLNWMLMAAIVVGLGTTVTACSDDDDDKNKSQQPAELADPLDTDEARVAWRWLNQLTSTETLTTDWASKTYEPTVGIASENNALTRIVVCTDLEDARQHFASLADIEVDKLGSEQTVSKAGVGKLTWTPSKANAQNLAEVAVDTKLIPKLQKIVFCTSEQTGLNGIFSDNVKGTAYYRLGDVVREDATGYYWVCVRPAFEQGDKGDSHWIHLFNASPTGNKDGKKVPFPEANIYSKYNNVKKYNSQTILLPTKLKYDRKHIYNLSNLIWAMINPNKYHQTVGDKGKGLCGFDYQYHGEKFLKNVCNFWDKTYQGDNTTVWQKVFNRTHEQMDNLKETWFFYQGYKWWTGNEATFWIYKSEAYVSKVPGSESGDKDDRDVVKDGFDVRTLAGDPDGAKSKPFDQFAGGSATWVVEYKTGKELSATGAYSPIGPIPGTTSICRYNQYVNTDCGEALETEDNVKPEDKEEKVPMVGYVLGQDGKFYKTLADAKLNGAKGLCVVLYVSPERYIKDEGYVHIPVEENLPYYGIAMGLEDNNATHWIDPNDNTNGHLVYCTNKLASEEFTNVWNQLNGLKLSQQYAAGCDKGHKHPIMTSIDTYTQKFDPTNARFYNNISQWMVPSVGQMKLAFQAMGLNVTEDGDIVDPSGKKTAFDVMKAFIGDNADVLKKSDLVNGETNYWTSTEASQTLAWVLCITNDGSMRFTWADKCSTTLASCRPFILFGKGAK